MNLQRNVSNNGWEKCSDTTRRRRRRRRSDAIPFLYSSSLKGCAIVGVPSWIGGSIGRFGFVGIVPWPLISNWCATWLAFNRHGGFGVVGSLDGFLIV